MRKDPSTGPAGAGSRPAGDPGTACGALPPVTDPVRGPLLSALTTAGLDEVAASAFADAALVLGAATRGGRIADLDLGFVGPSARAAEEEGRRPSSRATPGSMESHLHEADVALTAIEAIASVQMRLDAALVVATAAQTTSTGAALLAQKDVADPTELSATARERWRSAAKGRTRAEISPAIGWTAGESLHLVALAMAPVAFSAPLVTQMGRGQLPWRLARSLWLACSEARLDAADAAHVAQVMCGDDPDTCVPERLEPDGAITSAPWHHRAFRQALDREVAKLTHADDADPEDAAAQKAARDAAFAARSVIATVGSDGMGALTVLMPNLWVAAIKDRLVCGSDAARGAGDGRTLDQLQADIARSLLGHAALGLSDLPLPEVPEGQEITAEDLARAGWTNELIGALADLPAAELQVIVPLLGLHDPVTAPTLPSTGRVATRPDPNGTPADALIPGAGTEHDARVHTGKAGCPPCAPSTRTGRNAPQHPPDVRAPRDTPVHRGAGDAQGRHLWVGQLLGSFSSFVSPADVRRLALSPGTTMARLLVDLADGRCVERSSTAYLMDAAMREQILAADVTCRAPGCHLPAQRCQIDHVQEHNAGGPTSEANGQALHTGHHESKTAKHWDAELAANRDVTWTTLLGRLYRTRAWDYRRYVTLLTDAIDTVASARPEDFDDVLNHEVYLALTHRALGERLNPGDDDFEPDATRFEGWARVGLTHRDPITGQRASGPSSSAVSETYARWATAGQPASAAPSADASAKSSADASTASGADASATSGTAGQDEPDRQDQDEPAQPVHEARCPEPGHDHPARIGPYDYHRLSPPARVSHAAWAAEIAARLAAGEDCPPF